MEKIGGKAKWDWLCSFLAGTPKWHITFESPGHVLSLEKNPACPRLAQLRKLHLKLLNFFQPAGFFTEMLHFDKKIAKFQRNLLATLKIALDQKTWNPRK
jgi:hypothetical protein